MSEADDPSDRLLDFGPLEREVPRLPPGVQVTEDARSLMDEVERREGIVIEEPVEAEMPQHLEALREVAGVDYLYEVKRLLEDAERSRKYATRVNVKSQQEEILNPILFQKAVEMRMNILHKAVKLQRELMTTQAQIDFYREIVNVIAAMDRSAAHRLIERLRAINNPMTAIIVSQA